MSFTRGTTSYKEACRRSDSAMAWHSMTAMEKRQAWELKQAQPSVVLSACEEEVVKRFIALFGHRPAVCTKFGMTGAYLVDDVVYYMNNGTLITEDEQFKLNGVIL